MLPFATCWSSSSPQVCKVPAEHIWVPLQLMHMRVFFTFSIFPLVSTALSHVLVSFHCSMVPWLQLHMSSSYGIGFSRRIFHLPTKQRRPPNKWIFFCGKSIPFQLSFGSRFHNTAASWVCGVRSENYWWSHKNSSEISKFNKIDDCQCRQWSEWVDKARK